MDIWTVAQIAGLLVLVGLLAVYVFVLVFSHVPRPPLASETRYRTRESQDIPLPLITDPVDETKELTVVVPCFNESQRLPVMLEETIEFLCRKYPVKSQWEILVIDDESHDGTAQLALELSEKHGVPAENVKVCILEKNRGKGGAVIHGMKHVNSKYVMFADGDGASKFADMDRLLEAVQKLESRGGTGTRLPAVAIGSRAHMVKSEAVVKRSIIRNFLMYGLHTLVYVFGIKTIGDTQCGFKMFNHEAAEKIFPFMHTEGWIFDVEVLLVANFKNIPIAEVPISWHEVAGSKIDLAKDSIKMAIDLVVIRIAYLVGVYDANKVTNKLKSI